MDEKNIYAPPQSTLETQSSNDQVELASRWYRLWGALIDGLIAMVIWLPVLYLTDYWERALEGQLTLIETTISGILGFLLFILLHSYLLAKNGQTIGKMVVGTKIVSVTSNEILPLGKVLLLRYLPISVVTQLPMVGQFFVLVDSLAIFSKEKRCVHDLIAGTKVIKAR